jgi:hypothetical protein
VSQPFLHHLYQTNPTVVMGMEDRADTATGTHGACNTQARTMHTLNLGIETKGIMMMTMLLFKVMLMVVNHLPLLGTGTFSLLHWMLFCPEV